MQPVSMRLKIYANNLGKVTSKDCIPIFHKWIQEKRFAETLIDVADYSHVHDGPGVMLIAHEADYALNFTEGRLGLEYTRKRAFPETFQKLLQQCFFQAVTACCSLEDEPAMKNRITFFPGDCSLQLRDRLLAANMPATRDALKKELLSFFSAFSWLANPDGFVEIAEPKKLVGYYLQINQGLSLKMAKEQLVKNN